MMWYHLVIWFLCIFASLLYLFPKTMRALRQLLFNRTIRAIYGKDLEKYSGIPLDKLQGLEVGKMTFSELTDPFHDISPEEKAEMEALADKLLNDIIYGSLPDKERFK